jgi:nucleoside-triphosphatase THEP1|tara:strand:- start:674 stop:1201 length:528 start_codon:yes stop_codon:yes gene_type:complete
MRGETAMNIACTAASGRGDTDLLLASLAERLAEEGLRACGTVQINTERGGEEPCDMDVRLLPDGPVVRISQSLGPNARGCRLDPAALETAVGMVSQHLEAGTDLLIVNKFGKHEADGRGFRPVIAEALARGVPVLVGLNRLNSEAFHEFSGHEATELAPDVETLLAWVKSACGRG